MSSLASAQHRALPTLGKCNGYTIFDLNPQMRTPMGACMKVAPSSIDCGPLPAVNPYLEAGRASLCGGSGQSAKERFSELQKPYEPWEIFYGGNTPNKEDFKTEYSPVHQTFFSKHNVDLVRRTAMQRGRFNAMPNEEVVRNIMIELYWHNMPYSPYDRTDPQRCSFSIAGPARDQYDRDFIKKTNEMAVADIVHRMEMNRWTAKKNIYDRTGFRGVTDIPLPMQTDLRKRCVTLNLSERLLPCGSNDHSCEKVDFRVKNFRAAHAFNQTLSGAP